jgi:hypothetical protein
VLTWPLPDGRRIWPSEMTDDQLRQALAHGLRNAAKHYQDLGLDALGDAAGGDGGMEYLADVQSDAYFERAADRKALFQHMATIPRYAAVMREARGRVYARRAIEKAAGCHTPS